MCKGIFFVTLVALSVVASAVLLAAAVQAGGTGFLATAGTLGAFIDGGPGCLLAGPPRVVQFVVSGMVALLLA